ncbi:MAG TPA: polysaccharide ABC transporter ATP-binding protein [Bryobacteraceae bacterium]|nr:polysaccharide ABC transporter ATP-binding protein [Bryobacteraceae bacterium]
MSDAAIVVHGLSKRYRIGVRESYSTLRDTIANGAQSFWRRLRRGNFRDSEAFIWAVKDLEFTVRQGEVLGVIGRNGAGKSTLLKILSRITAPTEGYADIYGRVRCLLEVGTGFHPELTGRENIYLNGAILGMKRPEIARKFDAIVQFAEVEKFIDTPVKRFSSGMYLRLAFAVAAHLTSEILFVDEVLAVGDAAFQKKCLGKMGEVAQEGRTVLFVSHNMAAVRSLCTRALLLDRGRVAAMGDVERVLYQYTHNFGRDHEPGEHGSGFAGLRVNGQPSGMVACGEPFEVSCGLSLPGERSGFRLFCIIQDANGDPIVVAPTNHRDLPLADAPHAQKVTVKFPGLWLKPGIYSAHFKALLNTADVGSGRILSDPVMIDVSGSSDPELLLGYLTPDVEWSVAACAGAPR